MCSLPPLCPRAEGSVPLYLLPIRVRYETAIPERTPRNERLAGLWTRAGEGAWDWGDGVLTVSLRSHKVRPGSLQLVFSLNTIEPVRIGVCAIELLVPRAESFHMVDRFLRWSAVGDIGIVPDLTPLLVRWQSLEGGESELRSVAGGVPCRVSKCGSDWKLTLYLDAAALHPRWNIGPSGRVSTANPVCGPGKAIEITLLLSRINGAANEQASIPGRFPAGAEASLTITDHCDFDSAERLRVFLSGDSERRGWLGRGLRVTKSVFALPCDVKTETRAASLDDREYRLLIEVLQRDGAEIVPHGLSQAGEVKAVEFERALAAFAATWQPGTWIDHGCGLAYCYSSAGARDIRYRLLDRLRENGFVGLWAYHDVPTDPRSLNLLAPRPATFLGIADAVIHHLRNGRPGAALHYLRTATVQRLDGRFRYPIQELLSTVRIAAITKLGAAGLRAAAAGLLKLMVVSLRNFRLLGEPYTLEELAELAAVAYPERGVPLNQSSEGEVLLYVTAEAAHAGDVYTADAVHRLVHDRGLHIGHCYLLNNLKYISGLFESNNGQLRLKLSWCSFLDALSKLVSTGRVWNPTAADLLLWLRSVQGVNCVPEGVSSIRLSNTGTRTIRDYTLLVPPVTLVDSLRWAGSAPKGLRRWADWIAIWGDLPARSETVVSWTVAAAAPVPVTAVALG